ncbi:Ig-like domain-containing protein [Alloalcanivorax xenomutans]|uniref:Ig-like domain-containing protein n=1 Tax=Alloalcanivorax xenomutans TaxID=1094342 RepID=UPI003D9B59CF
MIRGTFNRTLYGTLLITACATVLTACGGSDGSDMPGNDANDAQRQSLLYAYPDDGQSEVAIPAPVVLRFSSDIELAAAENNIKLRLGGADGDIVPVTYSKVEADGRSILLTPTEKLQPLTDYTVTLRGVQLSVGKAPNRDIHFTTRALQRGPKSLVVADDDFTLTRAIPSGDVEEPVMDFSTFRFQFTQPIDPTSARYGLNPGDGTTPADTVALVDSSGELVEARLLTEGPYMTLDPAPEHLTPGETYTLTLGDGLVSTFGNTFGGHELTVTPQDSSPRGEPAILVQRITDSENRTRTSPLTGKPVNEVPVNATLLGQDNVTQASGDVRAELGDVTVYPDVTPVRIPADTILSGTSLDVLIGGEVPAGFESGEVKMHFLSDATGYLVPNPYDTHNRADALRIVRLFMDVAITTDEARANGGFTQDMLHIELIGVGEVDPREGVLKIDAVSVVEPDVLGQEFAHGMLSFQLESYKDQLNAPAPVPDTTPLEFQSWTLGVDGQTGLDKTAMAKPGDPIVLNFNRPLDRESIRGKVSLMLTDNNNTAVPQDIDYYVDGAALVIKPKEPLRYSPETNPTSYRLQLASGIKDLRGEDWSGSFDEGFELPRWVENRTTSNIDGPTGNLEAERRSPHILGLYPGYPCALNPTTTNLSLGIAGRCIGGIPEEQQLPTNQRLPLDDLLPIPRLPDARPIIIILSKRIDASSVVLGTTFLVEKINENGEILENVSGRTEVTNDEIQFVPDIAWEDGALYRYTLKSNGDYRSDLAECNAQYDNASICDLFGLPLQTQLLSDVVITENTSTVISVLPYNIDQLSRDSTPLPTGGGPNLVQYFYGSKGDGSVLQVLRTTDRSDINNNLTLDRNRHLISEELHKWPGAFGLSPIGISWQANDVFSLYETEEKGTDQIPDPYTANLVDERSGYLLDPQGVRPRPNSAKVLARNVANVSFLNAPGNALGLQIPTQPGHPGVRGPWDSGNVGCGYQDFIPTPDQEGCPETAPFFGEKRCMTGVPAICPQEKFTHLSSALFADVKPDYIEGKGIPINLYPGHVLGTSFRMVLKYLARPNAEISESGYQLLRLRYSKDDAGDRNVPIVGYIKRDAHNRPVFNASVDLYLDAPQLVDKVVGRRILSAYAHNLYSYPISMELSGPVTFLSDGRMVIDQFNINVIDINLRANSGVTYIDLIVPEKGSFLRYISDSIK